MTIREQLILDILQVTEQELLTKLQEVMVQWKGKRRNCAAVLALAGTLEASEGRQVAQALDNDFNEIEGEW